MKQLTKSQILQETLDMIKKHGRAVTNDKTCKYRKENHPGCALGRAILDEKYKQNMEGYDAKSLLKNHSENILSPEYRGHEVEFWDFLQNLHDTEEFWKKGLDHITVAGHAYIRLFKYTFKIK